MSRYLLILLFIIFISCEKDSKSPWEEDIEENDKTEKYIEIEMILVEGGTFIMGCATNNNICNSDEKPLHTVNLDSFYISKYEITNSQFAQFMNDVNALPDGIYNGVLYLDVNDYDCQIQYVNGKYIPKEGKENYPVIEVPWFGAEAFCNFYGGRLPTEAEWEFASRGGNQSKGYIYSGNDTLDKVGWYWYNSFNIEDIFLEAATHEVGTKKPNELGIFDMSGNVWEWCSDWYDPTYYKENHRFNPTGPSKGTYRVARGGSWCYYAEYCRVTCRLKDGYPTGSGTGMGFRFCKE
ncbi:MAG: formylglycine-generating enzyme family protein [Bacteroidales bacterium]|nr:formylglycine-generating enzyme family protein [Bacteroidales bacterium]